MIFSFWPRETTLEGYYFVLKNEYIWNGYLNTFERVILGVAIQIVMMVLFAYPLSRKDLPFRKPVTLFVVFTMFFSGGLIPEYLLIQQLGLYDCEYHYAVIRTDPGDSRHVGAGRTLERVVRQPDLYRRSEEICIAGRIAQDHY